VREIRPLRHMVHGTMVFTASNHRLASLCINKFMPLLLERLEATAPSRRNTRIANMDNIVRICNLGVRSQDYALKSLHTLANVR
jgi:hypothetical protein